MTRTRGKDLASISKRGEKMRLIDADALKIDMVIEEAETPLMPWYPSHMPMRKTDGVSIEQISNAPTIDAVPVVRCKDCTYYCPLDDSRPSNCLMSGFLCVRKDDFCSCGKEKR